MEVEWLMDFLELSATLNFSRAAEARHITQSAFSRRIRSLELWLGATLIDRSTYPASLTPAGQLFRPTAEEMVQTLIRSRNECQGRAKPRGKVVSFAALHTLALNFFPTWLGSLEEGLGPLKTRMVADNVHDCIESLVNGTCDLLICYSHPIVPTVVDHERFPSICLAKDLLVPVCMARPDGLPPHDLSGASSALPYLAYTPDCFLGRLTQTLIDREGGMPFLDFRYENSMSEALKTMALQGYGVAWLPVSAVERELADGRLVVLGHEQYRMSMDIRLYRNAENRSIDIEQLWSRAATLSKREA